MAFTDDELFNKMISASSKQQEQQEPANVTNTSFNDLVSQQMQPQMTQNNLEPWADILDKYINPYLDPVNKSIEQNLVQPLMQSPPGAALLGAMQGMHNIGASAANMVLPQDYQMEQLNTFGLTDPNYAAVHGAGDIGGSILGDLALYRGMGSLGKGAQGLKRVGIEGLKGAAAGYAGGEFMPGGRETSAAISAAAPFVTQSFSPILAKMIGEDAQTIEKQLGSEYENFFNANPEKIPKLTFSDAAHDLVVSGALTKGARNKLTEFLSRPTNRSAHDVMSALKAEQRGMLTAQKPTVRSLDATDKETYELISDLLDDVKGQMQKGFKKAKNPEQLDIYNALTKRWREEASPYNFPELQSYLKEGRGGASQGSAQGVTQAIHGMQDYPADIHRLFMKKYPELYLNKHMGKIGAGLGAAGLAKGFKDYIIEGLAGSRGQE